MKRLQEIAKTCTDTEYGKEDLQGELYEKYSLETERGQAFYESLDDEVLLQVLRDKAEEFGRSPSQKEIFWVWREYIKKRFQKWPYALKTAGLGKSAGKGGKALSKVRQEQEEYQAFLEKIREKAKELCRIPHQKEMPEWKEEMLRYNKSWGQIIQEAGIDEAFFQTYAVYQITDLEPEYERMLKTVKDIAEKLHRAPLKEELPEEIRGSLIARCGSYRNVLHQIGMIPMKQRHPFHGTLPGAGEEKTRPHQRDPRHCFYRVVNMDRQTEKDMETLSAIWEETGTLPERKKVDPELRKRVQRSCGSWANALYQLENRKGQK